MNLPCKVIQDMLPIYHDGVCSDESSALVEEHLKYCPACSAFLSQLRTEIEIPVAAVDDMHALTGIQKKWKKSKRTYITRGVCIALAMLIIIVSALTGIWYFRYGKYYARMAESMTRITGEEADMTAADYRLEANGYRFDIAMPFPLSNSGFVRVTDDAGHVMFLYPESGGGYTFKVALQENASSFHFIILNPDLTVNFEDHPVPPRTDEEKALLEALLQEQRDEIIAMFDAVYDLWGIEFLTVGK